MIGFHVTETETFTVVDLFNDEDLAQWSASGRDPGWTPAWIGCTTPRLLQPLKDLQDLRGTVWQTGKPRA